jgi:hypothetical protein
LQQSQSGQNQPWRVPVPISGLPDGGRHFDLQPDEATRGAIAKVAGIVALPRMEARYHLTPVAADGVRISGTVSATVEQTCVVSLEPVSAEILEPVELLLVPEGSAGAGSSIGSSSDLDPGEDVVPETLVDGIVDLGVLSVEFLVLGIDPYPRKPGVAFEQPAANDEPAAKPFAALAALKPESGKKPS